MDLLGEGNSECCNFWITTKKIEKFRLIQRLADYGVSVIHCLDISSSIESFVNWNSHETKIIPHIGDIRDMNFLRRSFPPDLHVDIIFHIAAYGMSSVESMNVSKFLVAQIFSFSGG